MRGSTARDDLVDEIFDEIRSRVQETDLSAPVRTGDWWYVTRTEEGASYPIHCRGHSARRRRTDEVLLDENAEADGDDFFSLAAFDVSPDHGLLAWSADLDGGEQYTLRIRDLTTGADLADVLTDTTWGGVAWSADSTSLFYVKPDEQMRPYQVWRHRLGTAQADDVLVFEEPDERFFVGVELTRSGEWIIIESDEQDQRRGAADAGRRPDAAAALVSAASRRTSSTRSTTGATASSSLTNLDAEDFRVMTAPLDAPGRRGRSSSPTSRAGGSPASSRSPTTSCCTSGPTRSRGCGSLFRDGVERVLDLGDEPHDVEHRRQPRVATTDAPVRLPVVHHPGDASTTKTSRTGERTLLKQTPVPNVDLGRYTLDAHWATADDGTAVPVDVVRHVDTPLDGTRRRAWSTATARYEVVDAAVVQRRRGCRCSTAAWCGRSPTLAAAASSAGAGTSTASCCTSATRSPTRSPCAEHLVAEGCADAERGWRSAAAAPAACWSARASRCARTLFAAAVAEVPFVDVVDDDERPDAAADGHRVGGVGRPPPPSRGRSYMRELLAVRQHHVRGATTRRCTSPPGSTTRGSATTSRPSGSPSCAPSAHATTRRCSCAARWAPATAARAVATTPGATRPASSPSCSPPSRSRRFPQAFSSVPARLFASLNQRWAPSPIPVREFERSRTILLVEIIFLLQVACSDRA